MDNNPTGHLPSWTLARQDIIPSKAFLQKQDQQPSYSETVYTILQEHSKS